MIVPLIVLSKATQLTVNSAVPVWSERELRFLLPQVRRALITHPDVVKVLLERWS